MSLARIRTALRAAVAALTTTSLVLTAYPQPGTAQQLDPVLEGRTLGQQLTVDPKTLFRLEDGTVTLQGGHEIPLEELFSQQGTGDAGELLRRRRLRAGGRAVVAQRAMRRRGRGGHGLRRRLLPTPQARRRPRVRARAWASLWG